QAEDDIRNDLVTGVRRCALPICRWRAATAAGLTEIPALIRNETDHLEVALIENLQRENLNAFEEAEALLKLKKARQYTDEQLARSEERRVGKARGTGGTRETPEQ